MLNRRTWPYGTRKRVRVVASETVRDTRMIAATEVGPGTVEGFVLIQRADAGAPAVDAECDIVFTAGGPMGGHWRFEVPPV
jgi:hypothetical protein